MMLPAPAAIAARKGTNFEMLEAVAENPPSDHGEIDVASSLAGVGRGPGKCFAVASRAVFLSFPPAAHEFFDE